MNEKEIKYFSMFTGVGGFELGIERANDNKSQNARLQPKTNSECNNLQQLQRTTTCIGFSEIDKYANQLLKNKYPEIINYGDCTRINPTELPEFDLLCGGFPCQSFSIAGKRRGFEDTRGTMFFEIARILEVKRPKLILLENVKGLLNHDKGETFKVILQTLEELGYEVQWMVLNSKFFGVPQNRERVFIIGNLRGTTRPEILPFTGSHNETYGELQEITKGESDAMRVYNIGFVNKGMSGQVDSPEGIARTLKGVGGGMGAKTGLYAVQPVQLVNKNRAEKPYNPDNREMKFKIRDDETSYTVKETTHEFMVKQGMRIRRLTPLECERLQSFPDGWTLGFSDTQRYKMMGNAVTVNVIQAIAEKLFNNPEKSEHEQEVKR